MARTSAPSPTQNDRPRVPEANPTELPDADQICAWLATGPRLDEVANELNRLRRLHSELSSSLFVLRDHALIALGETDLHRNEEEPF